MKTLTVVNVAAQLEPDAACGVAEVVRALDLALVTSGTPLHRHCAGRLDRGRRTGAGHAGGKRRPEGAAGRPARQSAACCARPTSSTSTIRNSPAWQLPVGLPGAGDAAHAGHFLRSRRARPFAPRHLAQLHLACPGGRLPARRRPGVAGAAWRRRGRARGIAARQARICADARANCARDGTAFRIAAAHIAGVPLLIAGAAAAAQGAGRAYFDNEVRPLLDRCRRWLGPLDFARRRRLLSAARCVLMPNLTPETSALVAMEAAACGTPVIAFRDRRAGGSRTAWTDRLHRAGHRRDGSGDRPGEPDRAAAVPLDGAGAVWPRAHRHGRVSRPLSGVGVRKS